MRDKLLEVIFIILAVAFGIAGYRIHPPDAGSYRLAPRQSDELRIVTWNVGNAGGHSGQSLRTEYLPHIGTVLKKLNADLMLLQEVSTFDQAQRLRRILGNEADVLVSPGGSGQLAILAQRGRLRHQAGLTLNLRALAAFYQASDLPPVVLMNIHANPYAAQERNALIGRATQILMNQNSRHLKILAGDLNLDVDLHKRRDLFTDDEHLDVETYNYLAEQLSDLTRDTGATAEPDRRLDYIFADTRHLKVIRAGPWKGQRVANMDHDPLVVDLRIERRQKDRR